MLPLRKQNLFQNYALSIMHRLINQIVIQGILLMFIATSCDDNRWDVPVDDLELPMQIERFDRDFERLGRTGEQGHLTLHRYYGEFYERYLDRIVRIGMVNDPAVAFGVQEFLSDRYVQELYGDVEKEFADMNGEAAALTRAFAYYRYHFPNHKVPRVLTMVSAFSYNVAVTDTQLAIGLDWYLGEDYKPYVEIGMPQFRVDDTKRHFMVYDAIRGWLSSEYENKAAHRTVLDHMIGGGKVLLAMDAMFPFAPDSMKIKYTPDEIAWCESSEASIWAKFIDDQVLYETDRERLRRYVTEAPFTYGLPRESPGQAIYWVGWQIMRAYAENNSEMSLEEIMRTTDSQAILAASGYKPKK